MTVESSRCGGAALVLTFSYSSSFSQAVESRGVHPEPDIAVSQATGSVYLRLGHTHHDRVFYTFQELAWHEE